MDQFSTQRGSRQESTLVIGTCRRCGVKRFPAATWCPACLSSDHVAEETVNSQGKLYSFTEVCVRVGTFDPPFVLGYVDLDAGPRVLGRSQVPVHELRLDQSVQVNVTDTKAGSSQLVTFFPKQDRHV